MFRIREAAAADNDALLRLEAQSPQGTGISIVIDRDDYFYRSRLHECGKVLVAEEKGDIVGIMAYAIKEVLIEGVAERVAYFYDLRGEMAYRRSMKRGLFRLWKAVLAEMEEAGARFIYGHVKADNVDSMTISTKMGAQPAATFDILTLPTLRGRTIGLDPHLSELDEEAARIESFVGERTLRPLDLSVPYRRGVELGYLRGVYRLDEDSSFAQVSVWDLSKIYRGRVLRMPLSLRLLGALLNPLAHVAPVPAVPRVGEQIAYWQLFDPICSGEHGRKLLRRLIQQIRRNAHSEGIDVVALFAYQDDPWVTLPHFFPNRVLHYHTMVIPLSSDRLPVAPLYLDIRDI